MLDQHNIVKHHAPLKQPADIFMDTMNLVSRKVKQSLERSNNARSYFIPACLTHMIFTRNDWAKFTVDNIRLDDLVHCWSLRNNNTSAASTSNVCAYLSEVNYQLVEKCAWPNCMQTCPAIRHPDNVKMAISPLDYFNYYGLFSMSSLARKLKLKETQLKKMSYFSIMPMLMAQNP